MEYIAILVLIIMIVAIVVLVYRSEEKTRKESADRKWQRDQKCLQKYEALNNAIQQTYRENAEVRFGPVITVNTRKQLIAYRFYYDESSENSYLSINLDNHGCKRIFKEIDGEFYPITDAEPGDGELLFIPVHLADDPLPTGIGITSYNDMERPMRQLSSLPSITIKYRV